MSQTANPSTAPRVRGTAMVLLITAFFGALWGLIGAAALPDGTSLPATVVVVAVTAALLAAAIRLFRLSRRSPSPSSGVGTNPNPFGTRAYRLAVLFQIVAIPLAAVVLNSAGYPGAVVSAVAVIVGLHFFGLVPAFGSRRFAAVGGAMVAVGLLSLLVSSGAGGMSPRGALVGLGCALVLWAGVFPQLASAWRLAESRPERGDQ